MSRGLARGQHGPSTIPVPDDSICRNIGTHTNAANMIQCTWRRMQYTCNTCATLAIAPCAQTPPPASNNAMSLLPAHFPTGCHVTVVSSHPRHPTTTGVVTRHTTKFVNFSPDDSSQDSIFIHPRYSCSHLFQ